MAGAEHTGGLTWAQAVVKRSPDSATAIPNARELGVDPWLYRYWRSTDKLGGAERYIHYHADLLTLLRPLGALAAETR